MSVHGVLLLILLFFILSKTDRIILTWIYNPRRLGFIGKRRNICHFPLWLILALLLFLCFLSKPLQYFRISLVRIQCWIYVLNKLIPFLAKLEEIRILVIFSVDNLPPHKFRAIDIHFYNNYNPNKRNSLPPSFPRSYINNIFLLISWLFKEKQ